MGAIFHNHKTLLQIRKEKDDKIDDDLINERIALLTENKPQGKILFDRTCKKWQGFINFLHKEDREILLGMILEIRNYNECCKHGINREDSIYYILLLFIPTTTTKIN